MLEILAKTPPRFCVRKPVPQVRFALSASCVLCVLCIGDHERGKQRKNNEKKNGAWSSRERGREASRASGCGYCCPDDANNVMTT